MAIKINFIPNILNKEGRILKEVEFNRDKTIAEYLKENNIDTKDRNVIITGRVETDLNKKIDNGDEILVMPYIEGRSGGVIMQVVGALLIIVGAVVSIWAPPVGVPMMAWGSALMAGGSIYSAYALKPRKPSYGTTSTGGLDEGSPTYAWDGIQTTQAVGVPLAIIYGPHKIGGNVITRGKK